MSLHHIAIASPEIEPLVQFYESLPGISFLEWKYDENQEKRSGWLQIKDGPILMIEKKPRAKAPEALVLSYSLLENSAQPNWTHNSTYTLYLKDPEHNIVGYSSYPNPLPENTK